MIKLPSAPYLMFAVTAVPGPVTRIASFASALWGPKFAAMRAVKGKPAGLSIPIRSKITVAGVRSNVRFAWFSAPRWPVSVPLRPTGPLR